MSTALTTSDAIGTKLAGPMRQLNGLMSQPAIKRSLPLILLVGLILAAGLAWAMLRTPPQKVLFSSLVDSDKAAVASALGQANIDAAIDDAGQVTVGEDDFSRARMLLASQGLPKAAPGGYAILDQLPMGVSRAVEGERLRQARETELARSIEEIDTVAEARVHLAMPESSVFVRDKASPSASVIVKLQPGRTLSDVQVRSILSLVASSVPGMAPEQVTIVDQAGALLSKTGSGNLGTSAADQRIEFQNRVEDKLRQQLNQMLTPLIGAGNFSAEVQADVSLDETQATRESYDKTGALRAEQGQWTGNQRDTAAPGGIPGALSNTAPPASTVQVPPPATPPGAQPGTTPGTPVAGGPAPDAMKQSDSFTRAYDLGREVSVTRAAPGAIRRLSVAVVLRDPDTGRRTGAEISQITQLVRASVGFDPARNDQVTVVSRKFAGTSSFGEGAPWYDAGWLPMVARNVTAIVIALLVLMLGVRPLAKALMKRTEETRATAPRLSSPLERDADGVPVATSQPVSIEEIEQARGYDDRIGMVRGFTRDNPDRAALAVRDMIRAEGR